ncbi:MAG: hypothetical protein DRP01_01980 [Archaeoglobales archaeon]|nr:MAG: hypothetical protein DRP01_01980 [Archaeoglobales archaeon]
MRCLYLGCGLDKKESTPEEEWVNVDIRPEVEPDLVWDMEKTPYPFRDGEFDLVLLKDSLEHVGFHRVDEVTREVKRILKPGGRLVIQCPDLEAIAVKVILDPKLGSDYKAVSFWVYGGQDYEHNYHKSGFTMRAMRRLLKSHGFIILKIESDGGTNMIAEAVKP